MPLPPPAAGPATATAAAAESTLSVPLALAPAGLPGQLRLFGVPRATLGGTELRFPDRKCVALLAVLALDGPCTRARLATLLWDGQNDADARRNLRRELHRLREAGFEGLMASEADTLQLHASVEVDTRTFVAALASGQQGATQDVAHDALALHGGGLLQGFDLAGAPAFNDWLAAQREALAQRWRAAAESHCAALQAQGDLRAALRLASALVQHDSLQEAHYRRVMALHAALGEREAALAAYERCRRQLGRELGLKPLDETVALADQIRAGLAAPPRPAPVPALQALPTPPLVGRTGLMATLQATLARHGLAVLQGEAGLGKSRLLQALSASTPGAWVHAARTSDRRVPFAALVRWLRAAPRPQQLPAWVPSELARLLPEWGTPPPPITTDAERLRLFEAVGLAWGAAFAGARLHVFDDWHLVDEASAAWWSWWLDTPGRCPVLVAERPGLAGAEAAAVLADALAAAGGGRHELPPLDAPAMFELVKALSGTAHPQRFAQRLWQATGGHPLYALETLQHLLQAELIQIDQHGQWLTPFDEATDDYRELPIAPSVQAAVMQRINHLAEAPRRLVEAASLTGDDFALPLVAVASALSEWDAVQALESALQARVLVRAASPDPAPARPGDVPPGLYRFAHDLFAQTVAGALSPERRRLMHRRIGQVLAQEGAAPARVADHLEQGAHSVADRAEACDWRLRALAAARQRMALADMLLQADRVLALSPPPEAAVRAHLGRSAALAARSQGDAAAEALAAARALLQPSTDIGLHVDVLGTQAFYSLQGQGNEAVLAALDGLLQDPRLSDHQCGRLLKRRSDTLRILNRVAEAEQALDSALAAFGDEPSMELGQAHDSRARNALGRGDFAAALQAARQAVAALQAVGDGSAAAAPLTLCGVALLCMGQLDEALADLQPARALAHRHGLVSVERGAILNLVPVLLAQGRAAEALVCLEEGYALSPTFRGPAEQQAFLEALYQCRVDTGDLGGALALRPELLAFSAQLQEHGRRHSGLLVAVDLPLLMGDAAAAAPALHQVLDELLPETPSFLAVQALAKGSWLALALGQATLALQRSQAARALPCQRPEDEALRAAFHAAALLANGQAEAARAALALQVQGVGTEVLALVRATALRVQQASGGAEPALQAEALQQLQGQQIPPLIALHLIDALAAGLPAPPADVLARARSLAASLHASLGPQPQAQACFAQRYQRWLAHPHAT